MIEPMSTLRVDEDARGFYSHVDILALANAKKNVVNARSCSKTWSCLVDTPPTCHGELMQDALLVQYD